VRRWDPAANGGQGDYRFTAFGKRVGHDTRPLRGAGAGRQALPSATTRITSASETQRTGEPWYVTLTSDMLGINERVVRNT
jgi:hypothetical protein